ncbi:MAG: chloride channel protein [Nitrososphaerota archaeon]|nr:chloride channel protein [Nitrososphaerota archaeon]MDG6939314.1 chloride channel protein [Nitrososphaerota archaeon]
MARTKRLGDLEYILIVAGAGLAIGLCTSLFSLAFDYLWGAILPVMLENRKLIFVFTMLGLTFSSVLILSFSKTRATGSGGHAVLEAYHLRDGQVDRMDTIVRPFSTLFTIGLGGAAGLEGAGLAIGGGLGSAMAGFFKFPVEKRKKAFLAGVAAGMASIFKAPLTAMLYSMEMPYKRDVAKEAYVEVAIASVVSYLVTVTLLGPQDIFGVSLKGVAFGMADIIPTALLGLVCGLYAHLFVSSYNLADGLAKRLSARGGAGLLLLAGGLALGGIGYVDPDALGIGYGIVSGLVSDGLGYALMGIAALLLLRLLTSVVTLTFGGTGGLFIPSALEGALLGSVFSVAVFHAINPLYVIVGIAGMLGGTHKLLLTPVAFVAETLGPAAIVPAVISSVLSYFVSGNQSLFPIQPYSKVKEEELALERIYSRISRASPGVLAELHASDVMTKGPVTVGSEETVADVLKKFEAVSYRVLPVVDPANRPIGLVRLEDISRASKRHMAIKVAALFMEEPAKVPPDTHLAKVVDLTTRLGKDHILVVDPEEHLLGVIAGIDVVRKLVHYYSTY